MEKRYDLEERSEEFAKAVLTLCKKLPKNVENIELIKQEVRASGSVGANYIEANDSLGKKDFALRIKICRKEAKESRYWLNLLLTVNDGHDEEFRALIQESTELMKIFGAILKKSV
jgi:four helix bundle protein